MKINILDAHDRLLNLTKQKDQINVCCQNIIDQRPFGDIPFYIFAHKRELGWDEKIAIMASHRMYDISEVPTHRLIWQPRLTKPKAQTNSMLFKGYPGTDIVKIIWIIPEQHLWDQYKKDNLTESQFVWECIDLFQTDRARLEAREEDDLSEQQIDAIYKEISREAAKAHSL